jgi:hypothetical protein
MADEPLELQARVHRLREVLLGYLQAAGVPAWPGADGLTVRDALNDYQRAVAAGRVPDLRELRRRHPDLVDCLRAFFGADETASLDSTG